MSINQALKPHCNMLFILLQTLVNICTSLILQERAAAAVSVAANLPFAPILSPPTFFADTVIKLASRLMHVMKEQCSLKELCGNSVNLGGPTRTEKVFVRLILPICIRLGSGRTGESVKEKLVVWYRRIPTVRKKRTVRSRL